MDDFSWSTSRVLAIFQQLCVSYKKRKEKNELGTSLINMHSPSPPRVRSASGGEEARLPSWQSRSNATGAECGPFRDDDLTHKIICLDLLLSRQIAHQPEGENHWNWEERRKTFAADELRLQISAREDDGLFRKYDTQQGNQWV